MQTEKDEINGKWNRKEREFKKEIAINGNEIGNLRKIIKDRDEDISDLEIKLKSLKLTIFKKEEEINTHKLDLISKRREILHLKSRKGNSKQKDANSTFDQSTRGSLNTMMERISQNITTIRNSVLPKTAQKSHFSTHEELLLKDKYIEEVNKKHL